MKIVDPYGFEPTNSSMRQQRLAAELNAWRMPRLAHWAQRAIPQDGTALTPTEWQLWLEILRVAEPVPPRNHIDGLTIYARLHDLRIEDLIRDKVVLVIDDQVAVRMHAHGLGLRGHEWSLLVPAQLAGHATHAVLEKRFREVEAHGDTVLATGSWHTCTDSVSVLVNDALAAAAPAALGRLWKLSLALSLEYRFLSALPAAPAKALAVLLGEELLASADKLDIVTDARLILFAAGQEESMAVAAVSPLRMPASRLAELFVAERFLDHSHNDLATPHYEALACAYARIADEYPLGDLLRRLPAGRALLGAIDTICRDRPELIATLVGHSSFHAEGAFALLQLPQEIGFGYQAGRIEVKEEWLKAQRLGRQLLLLADQTIDWSSLAALGVHDESEAIARRHYGVAPIDRKKAHFEATELWVRAVAEPERSRHYVEVLERYFRARAVRSDPAFIFALRMLAAMRQSGQHELATRLATAIVDGYVAGLALDIGVRAIPGVLCAYGELLAGLRDSLDVNGESWRKFLRPFDRNAYVAAARAEVSMSASSWAINPIYDVPNIFRAHADTLVALASAIESFDEPLQAALELYDADRKAQLNVEAFSWTSLATITGLRGAPVCEALFVRIGRLLGRDGARERLDAFLGDEHEAHILAYVAAGLGGRHPRAEVIQPKLRVGINALLGDPQGIALGHALELANVLQQAGLPRDSERLARRALQTLEERRPHGHNPYTPVAQALLAGALAQQQLWPELLAFEPQGNLIVLSPHARFIENMRALALVESGKLIEAEGVLRRVLEVVPADRTALVNLTALHLRAGDWVKVIEIAGDAKERLPVDGRDEILLNEAHAREQMGDAFGAAKLLDDLSGSARVRIDVIAAREELRRKDRSPVAPLPINVPASVAEAPPRGDEAAPAVTNDTEISATLRAPPTLPADAVDIAIVTVLKEEYEAVRERLTKWEIVPADGSQYPNLYGWIRGTIPKADGTGTYRVVLAWAGSSGSMRTFITTQQTINRWLPRYVLLSGIAGGLPKGGLRQGDLVVSEQVWYYEYGKVVAGEYRPRHRDTYRVDGGLLSSARTYESATSAWKRCGLTPPKTDHEPKMVVGLFASGEKVIDDIDPPYVQAILAERPDSQAIEMEGAGACAAVEHAHDEGKTVGFLMIRGISDMPASASGWLANPIWRLLTPLWRGASGAGTNERDNWKPYACALPAQFIASWIAAAWPLLPRSAVS